MVRAPGKQKGSGNFNVVVHGRAAHAGRDFDKGRNAIASCAEFISGLNALNGTREGVTINPGSSITTGQVPPGASVRGWPDFSHSTASGLKGCHPVTDGHSLNAGCTSAPSNNARGGACGPATGSF